jgi:hypothetical protein
VVTRLWTPVPSAFGGTRPGAGIQRVDQPS